MNRDEALARFRESRQGAKACNPFTIFAQGWDACAEQLADVWEAGAVSGAGHYDHGQPIPNPHNPVRSFPRNRDMRSSGWSGSEGWGE